MIHWSHKTIDTVDGRKICMNCDSQGWILDSYLRLREMCQYFRTPNRLKGTCVTPEGEAV